MPITPIGSYLTIDGVNTLFISDLKVSFATEFFDRMEFQHERLRSAPNSVGQHAIRTTLLGNTPAQIVIGSLSFQDIVPLNPDVLVTGTNYGNIKKKFNIVRYEISGSPSDPGAVQNVFNIAQTHIQYLSTFQAYLDQSASMETEYAYLKQLQLLTLSDPPFVNLTNSGVDMVGNAVSGTVSDILITNFSPSPAYEIPTDTLGGYDLIQSFTMTVEQRNHYKQRSGCVICYNLSRNNRRKEVGSCSLLGFAI